MNDKIFYPVAILFVIGMIALAAVWPQGEGMRSPAPFGHDIIAPDSVRAQKDKAARQARREKEQAEEQARKDALSASASGTAQNAS